MYAQYGTAFIFLLVGVGFVVVNIYVIGYLFRPRNPTPEKLLPYECGEDILGPNRVQFDIRFYTIALIFIIFDVEVVFLFPWARVLQTFKSNGLGRLALFEAAVFVLILFLGLVYLWVRGDLDWVKSAERQRRARLEWTRPRGPIAPPDKAIGARVPGEREEVGAAEGSA